ncbi:hypothetical protein [Stutzerimonas stutzeri]|uniref:hypothetical protein n=1 Tax=Stutzerimonas stutzeri TaxID=316 RepID=UPI0015E3411A|nr:hypothetical protein [Stutzerimonas stutzeri]MBA1279935.1 hypothetical protein [Stutzerimonas stutzeri]
MNREEVLASVDLIRASLSKRTSGTITGALLGELIRRITPGLDLKKLYPTGQKVLSRFIKDYCSEFLVYKEAKGGDLLYSIISDANEGAGSQVFVDEVPASVNYDLWLTFARPNSAPNIFVDVENTRLLISTSAHMPRGLLRIQSVTPIEMVSIRRAFIETLDPEEYELPVYSTEGKYSNWLESVRNCGGKLFNQWSHFRITRLHELFNSRLESLGVEEERRLTLCNLLKQSQENPPKKKTTRNSNDDLESNQIPGIHQAPAKEIASNMSSFESEDAFRALVLEAVKRMSLIEMRALNISAGLLVDSINSVLKK